MSEARFISIGADIGGTFTDIVVVDERTRVVHSAKVLTTPNQPEAAVLTAVDDGLYAEFKHTHATHLADYKC